MYLAVYVKFYAVFLLSPFCSFFTVVKLEKNIIFCTSLCLDYSICSSAVLTYYACKLSSYVFQGFSERLVTASRPTIGIMFKQVGIFLLLIFL